MTDRIAKITLQKTSILAGIGFLITVILAIIAKFVAFSNVIIPRSSTTTVVNIKVNLLLLGIGMTSYLVVHSYDLVISLALFIILKPVKKNLASLSTSFRMAYTSIIELRSVIDRYYPLEHIYQPHKYI